MHFLLIGQPWWQGQLDWCEVQIVSRRSVWCFKQIDKKHLQKCLLRLRTPQGSPDPSAVLGGSIGTLLITCQFIVLENKDPPIPRVSFKRQPFSNALGASTGSPSQQSTAVRLSVNCRLSAGPKSTCSSKPARPSSSFSNGAKLFEERIL